MRKIKDDYVSALNVSETCQTPVVALDKVRIGLLTEDGVVDKGYGERSLRQLGSAP